MRAFLFFLGEAWSSLRRNAAASIAAVIAMSAVLFLLSLLTLISHNVLRFADTLRQRKGISVFLAPGVGRDRATALQRRFGSFEEVASVELLTKEQALSDLEAEIGEAGLEDLCGGNPLPDVLLVRLRKGSDDAATMERLALEIGNYDGVEDVLFGRRWVEALDQGLRTVYRANALTGALATLAIVLVLATTLRLLVLMREEQIWIMKVVGATDAFVRAPFVIAGVLLCVFSALLAVGLTRVVCLASATLLPGLEFLPAGSIIVFLLAVAAVGTGSSLLSVEASLRLLERRGFGHFGGR